MEFFGIGGMAGLGAAVAAGLGLVWVTVRRVKRRLARAPDRTPGRTPGKAPARLEALAAAQADLAARFEAFAAQAPEQAPEARMQAMAGQMLGLIRDKNATMETALAGLDQLRARLRALEQMGEPAEARALVEKLGARLDELQAAQAAAAAAVEARLAVLAEARGQGGAADLAERLAKLHERKDAGLEAMLARLGPLETRLNAAEGDRVAAAPLREAVKRIEVRIEALGAEQGAARATLAGLEAEARGDGARGDGARALAEQLARLHAQKEALAEAVLARLAALEQETGARDPRPALGALEARLEARLGALEAPEASPFAAIAAQLTGLHAQKDAGVEAVFARLAPVEAKLAAIEDGLRDRDPQSALDRLAERLAALEAPGETPFAAIAAQLTGLYAQKDAVVETVFARLAPLEARLAETEGALGRLDPSAALDRLAGRLEAAQAGLQAQIDALRPGEAPFAEVSAQLTRLYAQKDAGAEAVFARLAPLEAQLAALEGELRGRDPGAALGALEARLGGLGERLAALESGAGEAPFAAIAAQLTGLYAQKDAGVEAVFARLAPLEAQLAALEGELRGRDPRAALGALEARLGGLGERLAALESGAGEAPFAEVSDQLTRLYAQKDAGAEAVLARLAPLEVVLARLAPLEAQLAALEGELRGRDPQAALGALEARLGGLGERLAALESGAGEAPFAEVSAQLTRLYAQKDAVVETVFARLAPLEAQLAALEGGLGRIAPLEVRLAEADPRPALDGFAARLEALHWAQGEVAAGLAALKAAGGAAPLAAISEQLTRLQAQKEAGLAAVLARLAPLEARLAEIEAQPRDADTAEARAQAEAIAVELIAARAAAERTALFADRLALLEASLPGPAARTRPERGSERGPERRRRLEPEPAPEPAPGVVLGPAPGPSPETVEAAEPTPSRTADALEDIWTLPRIVSLHRK